MSYWDAHKALEELSRRQGAPGLLRRLPRPAVDGAARDAPGLHRRASRSSPPPPPTSPTCRRIERWRKGDQAKPYDPNLDATRQEKRSYVCGQCHVEYFCGKGMTIFFPWGEGLKVEQMEHLYDGTKVKGKRFKDWTHAETGFELLKAQHPEFEMWSQGIHARSGVTCADCHMPYKREGAQKISEHWVRSPLLSPNRSCAELPPVRRRRAQGARARPSRTATSPS